MFVKDSKGLSTLGFRNLEDIVVNIHRYASCRIFNLFSYRLTPKCLIV